MPKEGSGRRRYVARSARGLYPNSPHLAKPERNHSHRLGDWHVDLNVSRDQAVRRIRRAALAGIRYGDMLSIKNGFHAL